LAGPGTALFDAEATLGFSAACFEEEVGEEAADADFGEEKAGAPAETLPKKARISAMSTGRIFV
jgi:hypothetical protein